jgi:bifunctional pyridoxal-dependent enzyme with beta-cystathionase and maltose regulon repressor activities
VSSFGKKSQELAEYLLEDQGVYCRPGTWYGRNGEGHFRLNFSIPIEYMDEALNRMEEGLNKLSQ